MEEPVDVEPRDVTALLDRTPPVQQAVTIVTAMARSYTRGRGFNAHDEPAADIAAVITTAAARLAANGKGLLYRHRVDDVETEYRSSFQGWNLAELAVLNRYRRRAR